MFQHTEVSRLTHQHCVEQISFMRIHLTEEAARALVSADVEAFNAEFPDVVVNTNEKLLLERFRDSGSTGCIWYVDVRVEDADAYRAMANWMNRLYNVKTLEARW